MNITNTQKVDTLKNELWWLEEIYRISGNSCSSSDYINCRTKALELFTGDAFEVMSIFDHLDFSEPHQSHIIALIPYIVKNLKSVGERLLFIEYINSLHERYPHLDFSQALFRSQLDSDFYDDGSSNNSASEESLSSYIEVSGDDSRF